MWGWTLLEPLVQDVRYGWRMLVKGPGFAAVAIITLALGIGANTTIFSLADALLFRPSPVSEPGRIISLLRQNVNRPGSYSSFSYPDYQDFRGQTNTMSGLAAYAPIRVSLTLNGEADRVEGEIVSGNYFEVLGVKPALGRTFLPEEDQTSGSSPVVVLSAEFWRRRFNADRGAVGRLLSLNGHSFTVIGVAPDGYRGLSVGYSPAFWVPLAMHDQVLPSFTFEGQSLFYARGCDWLDFVGRLDQRRTVAEAEAEAKALAGREAAAFPQDRKGWTAVVSPLNEMRLMPWNRGLTRLMGLLMSVVGLVLLIACSNIGGLLLARASARRKEFGIRSGLGADRSRLIRQLLTESLLLSALGGASAILLARLAMPLLATLRLSGVDISALDLRLDWRVLSFTLVLAAFSTFAFGVLPALQTSKTDVLETLKGSGPTTGTPKARLRQFFVVTQIALSLLLLVASGLLVRTLRNLTDMNLGYDGRNLLLVSVDLGMERYSEARARQFYQEVLDRVRESGGVHSASWTATAPLSGLHIADDVVLEGATLDRDRRINIDLNWIGPGFFTTLGIPVVAGREFTVQDREGTSRVAIVTESTARRLWPNLNPLGRRLWMHTRGSQPGLEVVGVVADGKYYNNLKKTGSTPFMFLPFNQTFQSRATLLVKGEAGVANLGASIREKVRAVDPNLPIFDLMTFQQQFRDGLLLERAGAMLVAAFGALALTLAGIGLFGLMSFSVGQRTHEIGIRMALGAQRSDTIILILKQGFTLTALGMVAGFASAVWLTQLMKGFLYGVEPTDPLTLVVSLLTLAGIALIACYIPARRATRVDPIVALRHE